MRVACLMEDEEMRLAVESQLRLWLPAVHLVAEATLAERQLPDADALVLDAPRADAMALERLRRVRAAGFRGAVMVVVPGAGSSPERSSAGRSSADEGGVERPSAAAEADADWARLAGVLCPLDGGAGERLAATLVAAIAETGPIGHAVEGGAAALWDDLWDTRRRLAVAELALQLQHALNNPLAALLAEAQLLELEQLLPDHRAAVRRMVELCRRMSETVRELEVARQGEAPGSAPPSSFSGRSAGGGHGRRGG